MIRKTIITLGIDSAATPAFFAVVVIVICVMHAVSGIADLVTDGETVYRLPGGSAMMTKIIVLLIVYFVKKSQISDFQIFIMGG